MAGSARAEIFRNIQPGPRARMAARLYASGAVPTKRAACEAVGLSANYLTVLDSAGNEVTRRIQSEMESKIDDEAVALTTVIQKLSRKALRNIESLMESENAHVALKASSDILDRNPETSKTFKAAITTFSVDPADAKVLAQALVEGAKVKQRFAQLAAGDYISAEEVDELSKDARVKKDPSRDSSRSEGDQEAESDAGRTPNQGEAGQGSPQVIQLVRE